jgi:hypothetical protein
VARPKKGPAESAVVDAVASAEADTLGAQLIEAFASLPTDAVLEVERRDEESKEWAYAGKFALEEFSADKVREMYGGGSYRAKSRYSDGVGKHRFGPQRTFKIVGPPKWTAEVMTGTPPERGGAGNSGRESIIDMGLMALFKQMQDNSAMQLQMMERVTNKAPMDWGAIIAGVAALAAPLLTALGNRKDPVEIAAQLMEATRRPESDGGGGGGAGGDFEQMLTILKTGMAIARNGGASPAEDADPTSSMINKGLDAILTIAQRQQHDPTPPPPAPGPSGAPMAPPLVRAVPGQPPVALRPWLQAVYPIRAQLVMAAGLLTPEAAAEEVLARIDDPVLEDLFEDFEHAEPAEWAARTGAILGLPAERHEWLLKVVQEIDLATAAEGEPPATPAPGAPVLVVEKPEPVK